MSEVNHSERKHALLSASGAHRWMNCTPSPRLEENFEDRGSVFAEEGTLAHEFCDIGLRFAAGLMDHKSYEAELKKFRSHELYQEEMEEHAQTYIDYVMDEFNAAKTRTPDAVLMVEEKLDYSNYVEDGFGTGDGVIIADGLMEVDDFKYGKGVRVDAEHNEQLMLYGLGALNKFDMLYDIHTVRLTVIQPRLDWIVSWEISVDDLHEWAEKECKPKAALAYEGKGQQKSGDWCKFCKAKAKCRVLAEESLAIAKTDFIDPMLLTDEEVLQHYKESGKFIDWLNSLSSYVLQSALDGKQWPGYKVVEGRSNRQWKDPDKVAEALQDEAFSDEEIFNKKIKGIGAIEKLVGKANFNNLIGDYVIKPPGKPTLALESDKRQAMGLDGVKNDFGI